MSRVGAEGASSPVQRFPQGEAHPGLAGPQPIVGTPRSGDPGGLGDLKLRGGVAHLKVQREV